MNQSTGTRSLGTTNIKLRNLQPGSENKYTDVAQYNAETDSLTFVKPVIYWDGTADAPSSNWPTEYSQGWWETWWGIAVLIVVPLLLCGGATFYFGKAYNKEQEVRREREEKERKRESAESIMRGVSLSYLLESLEADGSLEEDAHNAVIKGIDSDLLQEYDKDDPLIKQAVSAVTAANEKLVAAEEKCATLKLKKGDRVEITKEGRHYKNTAVVQELHWSPEEACVSQGAKAVLVQLDGAEADWFRGAMPCYMPTDLLKLDNEAFNEAVETCKEADKELKQAEAELKRMCREEKFGFVEKNTRGNYDPNFYQIKVTPSTPIHKKVTEILCEGNHGRMPRKRLQARCR